MQERRSEIAPISTPKGPAELEAVPGTGPVISAQLHRPLNSMENKGLQRNERYTVHHAVQ